MRTVAGRGLEEVRARAAARWDAIDPLLPAPSAAPGCGAELVVAGDAGHAAAIGTCRHWRGRPGSLDLTWGATRRFRLTISAAGADIAGAMDRLLSLWRDHLADLPAAAGDDTAAVVDWPSRDIGGVASLLRHGLSPLTVIAARPDARDAVRPGNGTHGAVDPDARQAAAADGPGGAADPGACDAADLAAATVPPGIRIRRAGPGDVGTVTRLGLEIVRFDAHFGCVIERPGTADALRRAASRQLALPRPWTWLAERDGRPVGLVQAEPPEFAGWIAPMVRRAPAAYLGQLFVVPGERGRGVAGALSARLHREIHAAGVAVTLLHYEMVNPLSGPFWSRQGYRPLWNTWEARPARALR